MLKKVLIVDMTHGGIKLATEFSKMGCEVFAWDIYHTLRDGQIEVLVKTGIKLVDEEFLKSNSNQLILVAPVHCKLEYPVDLTHHEAAAFIMKNRIQMPVIEVTGVKGKTSVVHMLKEIFKDLNPLILSSLGVEVVDDGESRFLERDLSITPANIITAWELGYKYDPGIFIVETSLGGTGLAQVGIITNIAENYPVASGCRTASQTKAQIFKSKMVVCDYNSYIKYYSKFKDKTNTFSIDGEGNVKASHIKFGLQETVFDIVVNGVKTVSGEIINDKFKISTFAPAPHHVENVLAAVSASLTFGMPLDTIRDGLKRFHGLKGRTSLKIEEDVCIFEEINPGINVTTIRKSLDMIKGLPESAVILGGKYGITCEEIDEEAATNVLNQLDDNIELILTDELGASLKNGINRNFNYISDLSQAINYACKKPYQNILLIYRSNFSDLVRR